MTRPLATPLLALLAGLSGAACTGSDALDAKPAAEAAAVPAAYAFDYACANRPTLDPSSPQFLAGDILPAKSQQTVNCYAWQSFVAMLWPADAAERGMPDRTATAATFGAPRSAAAPPPPLAVFETLMPVHQVFLPGGAEPAPWGASAPSTASCGGEGPGRTLVQTAKVSDQLLQNGAHPPQVLGLIPDTEPDTTGGQAGSRRQLFDVRDRVVWYEEFVNRAEYAYIRANRLYEQNAQRSYAQMKGIVLPAGVAASGETVQTWQDLGAMEVKASWRELTDAPDEWAQYHVANACLEGADGSFRPAVLGMVGFHIIRKTTQMQRFMWSTFEHVSNAPDRDADPSGDYSFYDASCDTCPEAQCDGPTATGEQVNVVRCYPLDGDVEALNEQMHDLIQAANPASVATNYVLVNASWPEGPDRSPAMAGATIPLDIEGMTSSGGLPVANTTLETYLQTKSCIDCHKHAATAADHSLATDYSFIFGRAQPAR